MHELFEYLESLEKALNVTFLDGFSVILRHETMVLHRNPIAGVNGADLYRAKVPNRLERIMDEFEAAYPGAMERVAAAYPELSETERQIAVLNFLHFRAKEEAELMGFAENTILKYRSNLNKKAGSDPISALIAEKRI